MHRIAVMAICVGLAIALSSLVGAATQAKAATIYVSANGNDAWSGTFAEPTADKSDGPVRTLERARDIVRKRRASAPLPTAGTAVVVRAGVYSIGQTFALDARDSGTPQTPAVFQAYPGEKVILAGGPTVLADAFRPVIDSKVLQRLDAAARGHVLQADLHTLGITDIPALPVKYQGAPPRRSCSSTTTA